MTSDIMTSTPSSTGLAQFEGQRFVNLETYRKDGSAVRTPLLFVIRDGHLFMRTPADSWKVKRLRRNNRVRVAPADVRGEPRGEWLSGRATVQPAADVAWYNGAARRKYGLFKLLMDMRTWLARRAYVVITVTLDGD